MKKGSLVTPSDKFLQEMSENINVYGMKFIPDTPKKGDIFVCSSDPYMLFSYSITPVVEIEGLKCYVVRAGITIEILLNTFCWDELQPPDEVNIENIMRDVELHEQVMQIL